MLSPPGPLRSVWKGDWTETSCQQLFPGKAGGTTAAQAFLSSRRAEFHHAAFLLAQRRRCFAQRGPVPGRHRLLCSTYSCSPVAPQGLQTCGKRPNAATIIRRRERLSSSTAVPNRTNYCLVLECCGPASA